MSVTIAATQQPASWLQRLTGTEPKTVIRETSTTEVTSVPGGSFNLRSALRNGGIGAAVVGALGGVSLLGKIALPIIGKVGSLGGLIKLAGVGGALGVATAAIPLIAPKVKESPAAKAALVGAGIGAVAGAVLPLLPTWLGAAAGAGVGLLIHNRRNAPVPNYTTYPGYNAYPGFVPVGMSSGSMVPNGMMQVTPNYGSYAGMAMNPYGGYGLAGYGYPTGAMTGYGMMQSPYGGSLALPMQAASQPQATGSQASPASTSTSSKPRFPGAKTWVDKAGNVRQVGTGKVLKAATGSGAYAPPVGAASSATPSAAVSTPAAITSPYDQALGSAGVLSQSAVPTVAMPMIPTMPTAGQ